MRNLNLPEINLFAKLEYNNFSGSIKDRAAINILTKAIEDGRVNSDTTIVESSSGNFALALASFSKVLGLKFIPVIDPNINHAYETQLNLLCSDVVKVQERDNTDGYLLTRIEAVKDICKTRPNSFWTNQYENPDNYLGYYNTLGVEISEKFDRLDYVFIAVSSGGTISGVAKRLKERFPNIKIIAVDIEGSVIFQNIPKRRYVSGLGSSKVPSILQVSLIDDVVIVSHKDLVKGCYELMNEQMVLAGGSSGAAYAAIKEYFRIHTITGKPNVVFLCADRAEPYLNTIYNADWARETLGYVPETADAVIVH